MVAKAEWIENYLKDYPDDEASEKSLKALQEAIPEPISFDLLDFNLGERWIPMSVYEEFAGYLFETKTHIHYTESIDEFSVNFEGTNANITDKYFVKGEKRGYYGNDLLKHAPVSYTHLDVYKRQHYLHPIQQQYKFLFCRS